MYCHDEKWRGSAAIIVHEAGSSPVPRRELTPPMMLESCDDWAPLSALLASPFSWLAPPAPAAGVDEVSPAPSLSAADLAPASLSAEEKKAVLKEVRLFFSTF